MEISDLFSEVIERSKSGVVYIEVVKKSSSAADTSAKDGSSFFNDPDLNRFFGSEDTKKSAPHVPEKSQTSHGSGFVISSDGYVLTNGHVIDNSEKITITLANKKQFPARIIGLDSRSDVGLVKIDASKEQLTSLPLGNSDSLKSGEWVLAFGSPFEHIQTVTAGIVSATGRNSLGISDYEDFIQTDAAINPGNSGGPLVNIHGEVIGINTAFVTQTGGYMGVGFAVPIDMAQTIAAQLRESGAVTRGWLGVALKDAESKHLLKQELPTSIKAARIVGIKDNSPAAQTDLAEEDLIISIDKVAIDGAADLRNRIALTKPDTEVVLGFYRNGNLHTAKVTLGKLK
jgi:serine protease Do